jgi:hypothetical protein
VGIQPIDLNDIFVGYAFFLNFPLGERVFRLSQNETKLNIEQFEFSNEVDVTFPSLANFLSFFKIVSCRNHSNESTLPSLFDIPAPFNSDGVIE